MKCDKCGEREASVHYTEIKDDQVREMHLCDQCASEKGFTVSGGAGGIGTPNLLAGMAEEAQGELGEGAEPLRCDHCGLTYARFKASGRLGCAHCYDAFQAPLVPLLRRIHGSRRHLGKIPRQAGEEHRRAREIRNKKERLDACVRREEYEEAARIRDEIRRLESEEEA
ncbi:MAG: UvrB/UvrC motif-containing protein [Candidatus Eisenbacteria bacterium]|nr:UvrB/UvrC motif-containing protein [Candidatus Eisenbacteria bacterium]